jgi:glycosyltransferase involved in cell wall biosynthesis
MASEQKPPSSRDNPRVILSIRHYYPDGGGAEVMAHRLAACLVERGIPLEVLTGRYGGRRRAEKIDGVTVHRHFVGPYIPVLHELCYQASLARELVARRHAYDVVHVFQTQLGALVAVAVAGRMGKGVITTCHSLGLRGDMAAWSSVPAGALLLSYVSSRVGVATGVSHEVMAGLHKAGFASERTWYTPNGVPLPRSLDTDRTSLRAHLGLNRASLVVVFVGRLTAPKMPEWLLDAWVEIAREYPDTQLVFVGDGEKKTMLEGDARRAGLEKSVFFRGQVSQVEDYLKSADIYVLPSTSEGMPLALLEAMAVGLPVIVSRVGGICDVIRHDENGLLFEPGDTSGLVRCLSRLMASRQRRSMLGAQARRAVEQHFSLNAAADRYVALYRSLWPEKTCHQGRTEALAKRDRRPSQRRARKNRFE